MQECGKLFKHVQNDFEERFENPYAETCAKADMKWENTL